MRFGPALLEEAEGKVLGHNVVTADGKRVLRKGRRLTADDITTLTALGRQTVYVADLEPSDVDENLAAQRIASALKGANVHLSAPSSGRVNLYASTLGLLRVDEDRLLQVNMCDGVTLATLPNHTVVHPQSLIATLKVVAYAIPEDAVHEVERIAAGQTLAGDSAPLLHVDPLWKRRVGLILSSWPQVRTQIVTSFEGAFARRLAGWGAGLTRVDYVSLDVEDAEGALAAAIRCQVDDAMDLLILASDTAIMDQDDIAPRAVERAGGRVVCFGAPVDPGNLLMLARHGAIPIVGAPGCARSPKRNIIDLLLPRLLAGDYLTKLDILRLAHGGLLDEAPERPQPRERPAR